MANCQTKTCYICKQDKGRDQFSPFARSLDGLYSYCRQCERERRKRKRRERDPEWAAAEDARDKEFSTILSGEVWKDIPEWEGWYQASSCGRVRSMDREINAPNRWGACIRRRKGQILKQRTTEFGHMVVGLAREGLARPYLVHGLVCGAFHGPCPPDKQHCAHKDGNPVNNSPDNLRWATVKENSEDARRHGTMRVGSQSNLARLDEATIREIRRRYDAGGISAYRLAKEYGTSTGHMSKIVKRENWKHV